MNRSRGRRLKAYKELVKIIDNEIIPKSQDPSQVHNLNQLPALLFKLVKQIRTVQELKGKFTEPLNKLQHVFSELNQQRIPDELGVVAKVSKAFHFTVKDPNFGQYGIRDFQSFESCEPELESFLMAYGACLTAIETYHPITQSFAEHLKLCFSEFKLGWAELNSRMGLAYAALKGAGAPMHHCFCKTKENKKWQGIDVYKCSAFDVVEKYKMKAIFLIESPQEDVLKELLQQTRDNKAQCYLLLMGFHHRDLISAFPHVTSTKLSIPDYYQFCETFEVKLLCMNLNVQEVENCQKLIPAHYMA